MNEVEGTVVRVANGVAWVRIEDADQACGGCQERTNGCALRARKAGQIVPVASALDVKEGDAVRVCARQGAVLRAVLWAYFVPLLCALGVAAIAFGVSASEAWAYAGLLLGLALGFLLARLRFLPREPILSLRFKDDD
ncbi:MAG: SoxR reducing system RseC family protein [Rhodocyclaceae bacterium]|nr:SoxR reducing system RseC family protein [Rhodocyclaceae bacterium]